MRKAFVAVVLLVLSSSTVSAAPPPDLPSFLSSLGSSCAAPVQAAAGKDGPGGITAFAYCSADCGSYSVSCSGGTCSGVDRNCAAGQQGYVQCDGVTTYCPACGCNEGWVEWRDGGCCQGGYLKYLVYECINGSWSHVDTFCDSITCF